MPHIAYVLTLLKAEAALQLIKVVHNCFR